MKGRTSLITLLLILLAMPVTVYSFAEDQLYAIIYESLVNYKTEVEVKGVTEERVQQVIEYLLISEPLISNVIDYQYSEQDQVLTIKFAETCNEGKQRRRELEEEVDHIVHTLDLNSKTDLEKELLINDYLCENVVYDYNASFLVSQDKSNLSKCITSFTAYGSLIEGKGVCEAYAEAFKLLADEAGLKAELQVGFLEGIPHKWCRVLIDGKWYNTDPTENRGDYKNTCFNLSDTQLRQIGYSFDVPPERTAHSNDLEYYRYSGLYANTKENIINIIETQLTLGNTKFTLRYSSLVDEHLVDYLSEYFKSEYCDRLAVIKCKRDMLWIEII